MVFKFKLLFIINYYTQGYTQSYMIISKASDKKKQSDHSVSRKLLRASQHSQLIS